MKLWEGLERDINYNAMVSQRGVLNLFHSDAQRDAYVRRGNAMRFHGVDAELLDRLKSRQRPMPEPPAGLLQPDFVSEKITDAEKRLSYPEPAEASDAALPQPSRVKAG